MLFLEWMEIFILWFTDFSLAMRISKTKTKTICQSLKLCWPCGDHMLRQLLLDPAFLLLRVFYVHICSYIFVIISISFVESRYIHLYIKICTVSEVWKHKLSVPLIMGNLYRAVTYLSWFFFYGNDQIK